MIRLIVMTTLGVALLGAGAVPAQAEKAPPRPAKAARARVETPVRSLTAPDARAERDANSNREAAATRALRRAPSLPHPFREQVRPEGRV